MDVLTSIFGTVSHVGPGQECARAALVFAYGLFLIRISGRRTFGKWSAMDLIVAIVTGSALSRSMTGGAPLGGTMAAVALLVAMHWALAMLVAHYRSAARILEGEPLMLAEGGRIDERIKRAQAVSDADIAEALHRRGLQHVSETQRITLDANGTLNAAPAP